MLLHDASLEKRYLKNATQLISIASLVIEISHRKQGDVGGKKISRKDLIYFRDQLLTRGNLEKFRTSRANIGRTRKN